MKEHRGLVKEKYEDKDVPTLKEEVKQLKKGYDEVHKKLVDREKVSRI